MADFPGMEYVAKQIRRRKPIANDKDALKLLGYQPNIYPATVVRTPEHGLKGMWEGAWGSAQD